jgi:hypothetical protein
MTPAHEDEAARAEREILAQLAIIRALKPLTRDGRERVLKALWHMIEAEKQVGGILALIDEARKQ